MAKTEKKLIANNKKAYHDYFILEKYEVGLVLHGTEVKSLRMGKCSIKESFIRVEDGEMYIYGMHISPYEKGNIFNKDPLRVRKLLLHKKEILKISGKMKEQGITVVPLQVYFSGSLVKMEIGLAKGKKLYDKRDDIAKKDQQRPAPRDSHPRKLSGSAGGGGRLYSCLHPGITTFLSEINGIFYCLDITGKDDSVHTGIFRSLDIFFKIVNKEAFRRIQIKFAEEIFVNFLIRFCHVDRSREQDPVKRLQDLVILHIICKVSRCIGKEIDRDSPLFQFPDKCKRLWQWLCTARPFTEEKIHGIIKPFGNRTQNFISILLIIDRTAVQFSPVCIDQIAEIIDISRISNKRTNDLSAVKSSNHISKVKYDILIFHSKAPFREYSHLS